jgi:hypothetical protein
MPILVHGETPEGDLALDLFVVLGFGAVFAAVTPFVLRMRVPK